MKKILEEDFITTNWSGGTTSQIFIDPADSSVADKSFNYRISSATCDLDQSDFTPYSDFERYITPLNGNLKLINNGNEIKINPFEIYFFDGSDNVTSIGKVRDYNLIVRKGHKGLMYSKKLEDSSYELKAKSNKVIVFNYQAELFYEINGEKSVFDKFSALELTEGEKIVFSGKGKILVCEIN